jgi:hypothetical protein
VSATKPTPIEALDALQRDTMQRIRTATPGVVVSYDPITNTAAVQPAIGGVDPGSGLPVTLPIYPGIPVCWPRGAGVTIRGELLPGDTVLLLTSDRAIDDWIQVGGTVPGDGRRMHSLADAVALPMLSPLSRPLPASAGRLVIARDDGTASIAITLPSGGAPTVTITAPAVQINSPAVTLQSGTDLATFLTTLQTSIDAWTPVPHDGGAALKAALTAWLLLPPPT